MGEVKALLGSILGIIILGIILTNADKAGALVTDATNGIVTLISAFNVFAGGPGIKGMAAAGTSNPGSAGGAPLPPNSGGTGGANANPTPVAPPSVPTPGSNNPGRPTGVVG